MKTSEENERKLLDYLDGTLTEKERLEFEGLLEAEPRLKAKLHDLRNIEASAKRYQPEMPSRNFTAKVMANLYQRPIENNASIFNSILLLTGIIVLVGLCSLLLSAGIFDGSKTIVDLNEMNAFRQYLQFSLPSIGVNGKILVNIIIFLNIVIALIVFDRSVLKPLFQKRLRTGS
jgi:anti-sigma factor RsiW